MNHESFTASVDRLRVYADRASRDELTARDLDDVLLACEGIRHLVNAERLQRAQTTGEAA